MKVQDHDLVKGNEDKGSEREKWIPSKRSSKKTLAEAIAKREKRMRERKLGCRTLSAIAIKWSGFGDRRRENESYLKLE